MSEEQRKLMHELQIADFNVIEWDLYMHTHPDDLEGCQKLYEKTTYAKKIRKHYEALYGPLTNLTPRPCDQASCTPWPWQV
ncbi:spore coat protein CotJB [Paenisporosarcina indica]|uniref:spore coat protein CotJB n=1 Tax=Paenisporosarcina indica TaxID=650093 RepID=UPI00094FAFD3|nr:spore coat protein CotJB [Paenisporosarcina indica]